MTQRLRASWPAAIGLLLAAALWLWAAQALWASTPLPSLDLPHLNPQRFFTDSFLGRSANYERFLAIENLVATATLVAVLVVYAKRGARLVRESAAGRVGTGLLLAMLGFAVAWLATAPFELVALWWQRRYGVSHQGYLTHLLVSFLGLGSVFVFVCVGFAIAMGLAGVMRRFWWLAATPALVGLALLFAFVSPYLMPDTEPVQSRTLRAEARALERIEGAPHARLEVQKVHRFTDAPNAESLGFGPSSTVVLWDTLLRDGFDRKEVRFVLAHELGHIAHEDPLKRFGWLILFLLPTWGLVAFFTRRRGGLARPEAVPLALLVLFACQLLATPLLNVVSRRAEASADWAALEATHEPATDKAVMRKLSTKSLNNPDPPTWTYVLYNSHPTTMQRLAMAQAWEERRR